MSTVKEPETHQPPPARQTHPAPARRRRMPQPADLWHRMTSTVHRFTKANLWVRLLRLPRNETPVTSPGLVLIQIDGLAREQFERAIARGRMPFLRRLLQREGYRVRSMFSGVPSTTPAVQGELFYGVPQAVPAFGYRHGSDPQPVMMNQAEHAARVQRTLEQKAAGLLQSGSAQSNIYTGGAAEPRFCAAAMGWGDMTGSALPGARLLFALAYTNSLLRAGWATVQELAVALWDFGKGVLQGRLVRPELRIIPSRVAVGVLLRDAITSCACLDAERGLPVIQLNYLGYDEKAHCRGPSSRFAHRSLSGIDRSIQRIWKAAKRSKREYEVWVYSDHGQEEVEPYVRLTGKELQQAVDEIWSDAGRKKSRYHGRQAATRDRAGWLGGLFQPFLGKAKQDKAEGEPPAAQAIATGPLGYLYLRDKTSVEARITYARRLVKEARVPMVIVADGAEKTHAFTAQGEFQLPAHACKVLGEKHPFAQVAAEDLVKLCRHEDAGEIMICGWRPDEKPVTFVQEFGAHGGPGASECSAFVLAPEDSPIPWEESVELRPAKLREHALAALDHNAKDTPRPRRARRSTGKHVRVMTYNVHSCRGIDGKVSPERVARIIEQCGADIVGLQELDVRRRRTGQVDQAQRIASLLGWNAYFNPALRFSDEQYGDAILSRFDMRLLQAGTLPGTALAPHLEPRGALWVEVDVDGTPLQFFNTHMGLLKAERALQVEALLGPEWLGNEKCQAPVVLCGDFNALPRSAVYRRLAEQLTDVQATRNGRRFSTFFSAVPLLCIDHIFTRGVRIVSVEAPRNDLVRRTSDHLPLVAELEIP